MALEETVVLDIADGLHQIDALEEALTNSALSFKVALADALDVLNAVQVQDVDASQITTSIDSAVAAADLALEPEVDASTVTTSIDDAVNAADTNIEIEALTASITDDINESIAAADTTLEIDADVSQAEDAIGGLSDTLQPLTEGAGGASDALGGLAGATNLFAAGARTAAGDGAAASGAVAGLGGAAATTVGVVGALGFATKTFTDEALAADAATRRFKATFGPLADDINQIDIGGLNESLSDLALRLGADDDQLRQAASSIGAVGISSGKTREEVAATAEQIIVLAANASALNPALGTADQIIGGLTNGLARGGRFLGQFGIALTSAEINARALADTGKETAADLTVYEKAAAGAALASEQLGTSIAENINKGAESPTIKLRALKQSLLETFEGAGKDLIDPLVNSFEALEPVLEVLARLLGPILLAALTVLAGALKGLDLALGFIAEGLGNVFDLASHLPFVGGKFADLADSAHNVADGLLEAGSASDDAATGTDKAGDSAKDAAPKFDDLTQAVTDSEKALNDLIDAEIAYLDSTVASNAANVRFGDDLRDVTDKQKALTEAVKAHGAKSTEAADAQRDLEKAVASARDSALSAAEAQLRLADDTATAEGHTLTATERQGIFRDALVNLANQATGPTKTAILELIAKLDEAAGERVATLTADTTKANAALSAFTAEVQDPRVLIVDANTKMAADKINRLVQDPRVLIIDAQPAGRPGGMAGGTFAGGDTGMAFDVGERGREVVFVGPNQQATVVPAERSHNLFGNGSMGEAALLGALNRLATQKPSREGPAIGELHMHEVSGDPRANAFAFASILGEESRR